MKYNKSTVCIETYCIYKFYLNVFIFVVEMATQGSSDEKELLVSKVVG